MKMVCLHAAQSNVNLIDETLDGNNIEVLHIVDSHLITLIREQKQLDGQKKYALKMMRKLIGDEPDIILVTCTNYIALLDQLSIDTTIPIVKIDELLFEQLEHSDKPIKLLFTNEHTIEGTLIRLNKFIATPPPIEIIFIPEVFEWYLNGETERHDQAIVKLISEIEDTEYTIVVAQLSMSSAVSKYNTIYSKNIISPGKVLHSFLAKRGR